MTDKGDLRLCIDRVIPLHHKVRAMDLAVKENPKNKPKLYPLLPGVSNNRAKLALLTGKLWSRGRELGVAFLDGSDIQKRKVREHAVAWCDYANIKFNFSAGTNAEIRISFCADPGSWSGIGTDCLHSEYFRPDEPTMNFGWLKDDTDDVEYRRVVVHEFGHALGAIHEHQNPKGGIKWNVEAVYQAFSGPPNNWTKQEIDVNILHKYSENQLNGTKFDIKSIMLYAFPPELIIGGRGTPENTKLSLGDKRFIAKMYPGKK
jgi:hypothetical protein